MKCTNKTKAGVISCLLILSLTLTGCGSLSYSFPYDRSSLVSGFKAVDQISTVKAAVSELFLLQAQQCFL